MFYCDGRDENGHDYNIVSCKANTNTPKQINRSGYITR